MARIDLRALALVVALLPAGAVAPARADDAERTGTVTLSSGETLEGALRLTRGKTLDLFETSLHRRLSIGLPEIARITATPEHEEMAQAWRFLEEGNDKKVKLPYQYPLRKLVTEITLTSGAVLRGHLIAAPLYVRQGDDERRVLLVTDQKGEPEETLAHLVFVREVAVARPATGTAAAATLAVRASGASAVRALDIDHASVCDLDPDAASAVVPGRYDLFVRAPGALLYGITVEKDDLGSPDRAAIQTRIDGIEEFFDEKEVRALAGTARGARALVELRRARPSYSSDGKAYGYIRWELWSLERSGERWDVTARLFLFRERVEPGAALPRLSIRAVPACAGVEARSGATVVTIEPGETEEKR